MLPYRDRPPRQSIKVWRFDRFSKGWPEEVTVTVISHTYVLVEGEEHTTYAGNFYETALDAWNEAISEAERRIESAKRDLDWLVGGRERFFEKNPKLRKERTAS